MSTNDNTILEKRIKELEKEKNVVNALASRYRAKALLLVERREEMKTYSSKMQQEQKIIELLNSSDLSTDDIFKTKQEKEEFEKFIEEEKAYLTFFEVDINQELEEITDSKQKAIEIIKAAYDIKETLYNQAKEQYNQIRKEEKEETDINYGDEYNITYYKLNQIKCQIINLKGGVIPKEYKVRKKVINK